MANLPYKAAALIWVGGSRKALSSFPKTVKGVFGFALRLVQNGETPVVAKRLAGYGAGVFELLDDHDGDTYRVVYLVNLKKGVYVIDAFKKKSKSGRRIPKEVKSRLEDRIKNARRLDEE